MNGLMLSPEGTRTYQRGLRMTDYKTVIYSYYDRRC
jgi:hypothetical protein